MIGMPITTLFAAEASLFPGCDVATNLAGASIGNFRWVLGGVDDFRLNRIPLFVFFALFIGRLLAARLVHLMVFNNDLFTFSLKFLSGPRFALTRAPFLHLKHGLLQQFLIRGQWFPHVQSQCYSEVVVTVGIS